MNALVHGGNVFSLDALRPVLERRSRRTDDRRREARYICRERLFVQVVLCAEHPELVGRTEAGSVVDVSASGIHFHCALPLPVGTLVDIWVDISSRPGKFFLSGKVRWSESSATGSQGIGVELEEGPATDINAWRALMR
ncbi:MAG: PilZ domain-containing protein [Gammaproteobacteria bacterium]|nr:PilZ domain-containing protein [Gammaproteobacteria bacterium]